MANPLQSGMVTPPPPEEPNAIQSPQGLAQQPPAPTHAQTVATLRHFSAIKRELVALMKKPDFGKADMKSEIIDGVTKLVADRIIPPATAVQQLATVPERPFDQKKWIEKNYLQAIEAENHILDYHRSSAIGTGNYELENELHSSEPDNHMSDMQSMMAAHFGGRNG